MDEDSEAVSPVIATIILVAIGVVLGAVLFIILGGLGGGSDEATPAMTFTVDESKRTATLLSGPPNLKWGDFDLKGCPAAKLSATGGPPVPWANRGNNTAVQAGAVISGCASGQVLILTYKPSNGVVYEHRFF
jgi:hypothetical protein